MDKSFGIEIKFPFHKKNNRANDKGFGPRGNIQADSWNTVKFYSQGVMKRVTFQTSTKQ